MTDVILLLPYMTVQYGLLQQVMIPLLSLGRGNSWMNRSPAMSRGSTLDQELHRIVHSLKEQGLSGFRSFNDLATQVIDAVGTREAVASHLTYDSQLRKNLSRCARKKTGQLLPDRELEERDS